MRSRPLRFTIGALLGLVMLLAGCASNQTPSSTSAGTASQASAGPVTITDGVGREIELAAPVTRAVVANRYNSELIRAIGEIDKVVAVDTNTAQDRVYWSQFDPDQVIGKGQSDLNYEQIIKLDPEVLITPKNGSYETDIEKLTPAGIKVIVVSGWDTANMVQQIDILGKVFGNPEGAAELTSFFTKNMDAVAERVSSISPKKTIYWEYGDDFTTAIPGTGNDGWHQMMTSAGGSNIFGDPTITAKTMDPEKILQANPDLIIKVTSGKALKNTGVYTPPTTEEFAEIAHEMVARPGWADLKAVKNGNFYITTGFAAGGIGKMIGVVYTASWLYPEQMAGIDPDAIFDEWLAMQGMPANHGHAYHYQP